MARTAHVIRQSVTLHALGAGNVLLVDAGDEMQGSLLSNLGDGTPTGKGMPTIATYNAMGYNVATFGNHEFDWGQANLANRTSRGNLPLRHGQHRQERHRQLRHRRLDQARLRRRQPYVVKTVGTAPNTVKVAFIGVTTTETPIITVATATAGLCFKDPADSIVHYYDEMKAQRRRDRRPEPPGLSPTAATATASRCIGDQTLAQKLDQRRQAGQPDHRRPQPHLSRRAGQHRVGRQDDGRAGRLQRPPGRSGRHHRRHRWLSFHQLEGDSLDAAEHRATPPIRLRFGEPTRLPAPIPRIPTSQRPDDRRPDHRPTPTTRTTWRWSTRRSATPRSICRAATPATT